MENAADAIKIAFAMLVFMMGTAMLFSLVSSLRQTADEILFYSDGTNFYTWESGTGKSCRIVQEKEVIANLYNTIPNLEIIIYKDGKKIFPSNKGESLAAIINKELTDGCTYLEQVTEINSGGQYILAGDGTRIRTGLGKTAIQVIYIKQ